MSVSPSQLTNPVFSQHVKHCKKKQESVRKPSRHWCGNAPLAWQLAFCLLWLPSPLGGALM